MLGLPQGASPAEIKAAWRDLAKVWHPDRFQHDERLQGKAGENLKRINEAYESLEDYDPAEQPRISARIRQSVSIILGMGEIGDPPPSSSPAATPARGVLTPSAPIGRRRSRRVLGLGVSRATGEVLAPDAGPRRGPLVAVVILVAAAILIAAALMMLTPRTSH